MAILQLGIPGLPMGDIVRSRWSGAMRITTDGTATIQGVNPSTVYFEDEVAEILFEGATTAEIEHGIPLSDLTVAELQEIVTWAGVDTEAATKTGLKRAIERHYE